MEPKSRTLITDMTAGGVVSVLTQTYIDFNNQEIVLENHREALAPGQIERARDILPDNQYRALDALWTPEVIEAYEAKIAALSPE